MAILEEDVFVKLTGKNVDYYEHLGYEIPRYIDKRGRLKIKSGTTIMVKVNDLMESSNIRVTKICDECGNKSNNIRYVEIVNKRKSGNGKDRCFKCGRKQSAESQKNNVSYEKSLAFKAIKNNMDYLLGEYSINNKNKPSEVSFVSNYEFLWICPDCTSEYPMKMSFRTNNKCNCPYCVGTRVNHTNCLWTTHPQIAMLLKDKEQGHVVTHGSHKKEVFVCDKCGFEQEKSVLSVVNQGLSCSRCSDGISYSEKFMINLLLQCELPFETQIIFKWSRNIKHANKKIKGNKKYDFFIPSLNLIIETHGDQHYNSGFNISTSRDLEEENENDFIKRELAIQNGLNYIVVDCRKSELEFIKDNILKSELNLILPLNKINWLKCHEHACKSLVKEVCDVWNNKTHTIKEISDEFKVSKDTVVDYLKRGNIIGLCDYNAEERKRLGWTFTTYSTKQVIQLTPKGEYIKTWNSLKEISSELGLSNSSYSAACRGERKLIGGFKWMYKEDYEKLMEENAINV